MPDRTLTGSKIRRIRIEKGLRQAALARSCGISPSYLNLIEHNRRAIAGALLARIADALGVDVNALDEAAGAELAIALDAVSVDHLGELERSDALAVAFPLWAKAIVGQRERISGLEKTVKSLNDRLAYDPYLSASLHNVLSTVTAIRSTSGILANGENVEPEWQSRFHRNLYEDSQRLAEAAENLVEYLDADPGHSGHSATPIEELETWWAELKTSGQLPGLTHEKASDLIETSSGLSSDTARDLASQRLKRHFEDEAVLPLNELAKAISEDGVDPTELASKFSVSLPLLLRRIADVPAEEFAGGVPPGLVVCDGAGGLSVCQPTRGFEPAAHGAACALWPLFQALQRPATPIKSEIVVNARDVVRFSAYAVAESAYPEGFEGPVVTTATMLVVPQFQEPEIHGQSVIVGMTCQMCARRSCPARREPSII